MLTLRSWSFVVKPRGVSKRIDKRMTSNSRKSSTCKDPSPVMMAARTAAPETSTPPPTSHWMRHEHCPNQFETCPFQDNRKHTTARVSGETTARVRINQTLCSEHFPKKSHEDPEIIVLGNQFLAGSPWSLESGSVTDTCFALLCSFCLQPLYCRPELKNSSSPRLFVSSVVALIIREIFRLNFELIGPWWFTLVPSPLSASFLTF